MFFADSYRALRRGERSLAARRFMLSLLLIVVIALPVGFFLLRRFERAAAFHPERGALGGSWTVPSGAEEIWFPTADGLRLHGWFFRAQEASRAGAIIYFHGNGGNISYLEWLGRRFSSRGFDVLLFDYRGYGRSGGDVDGESGLYKDADAAYDYMTRERGAEAARLVLYGQSLGTAVAVDLAARRQCGALILESGFSSARDMAATIFPSLPRFVHGLGAYRFDSTGKLPRVGCPVLVAHGDRDEVIPISHGRALHEAAPQPKSLLILEGAGHNDLAIVGGKDYADSLVRFMRASLAGRVSVLRLGHDREAFPIR